MDNLKTADEFVDYISTTVTKEIPGSLFGYALANQALRQARVLGLAGEVARKCQNRPEILEWLKAHLKSYSEGR